MFLIAYLFDVLYMFMYMLISDNEEKRRIKVQIKPISPNENATQNNVDVIKKSIEGLRLSPTSHVSCIVLLNWN